MPNELKVWTKRLQLIDTEIEARQKPKSKWKPGKSPMLAATVKEISDVQFPVGATEKIDGIRALKLNGKLVSRSLKPIPNRQVRQILEDVLPEGADGELSTGTIQQTSSDIMSEHKKLDSFTFFWFDMINDKPYNQRMKEIQNFHTKSNPTLKLVKLLPKTLTNANELETFEANILEKGGEGVILRKLDGPYKFGRSTLREGFMLKLKRFTDAEAKIEGFEELEHADGRKSNLLGAFLVVRNGVHFKIGSGFTAEQRKTFWKNRDKLKGKLVKFKFFEVGMKHAPRHPVFLDFRNKLDLG